MSTNADSMFKKIKTRFQLSRWAQKSENLAFFYFALKKTVISIVKNKLVLSKNTKITPIEAKTNSKKEKLLSSILKTKK